jgi:uncharacterized protein (DUF736 family)
VCEWPSLCLLEWPLANVTLLAASRPINGLVRARNLEPMRTIGFFTDDDEHFVGRIETLTFQHKAAIVRNPSKRGKRAPDYWIYANGVQLGEARKATSDNGEECLSLKLDDPCFAKPFTCQLLNEGYSDYRLVWSR